MLDKNSSEEQLKSARKETEPSSGECAPPSNARHPGFGGRKRLAARSLCRRDSQRSRNWGFDPREKSCTFSKPVSRSRGRLRSTLGRKEWQVWLFSGWCHGLARDSRCKTGRTKEGFTEDTNASTPHRECSKRTCCQAAPPNIENAPRHSSKIPPVESEDDIGATIHWWPLPTGDHEVHASDSCKFVESGRGHQGDRFQLGAL